MKNRKIEKDYYSISCKRVNELFEKGISEGLYKNQEELGELTGYTQQYISAILNGKKAITEDAARKFAEVFLVLPNYILGYSDDMYNDDHDTWVEESIAKQLQFLIFNDYAEGFETFSDFYDLKKIPGKNKFLVRYNNHYRVIDEKLLILLQIRIDNEFCRLSEKIREEMNYTFTASEYADSDYSDAYNIFDKNDYTLHNDYMNGKFEPIDQLKEKIKEKHF